MGELMEADARLVVARGGRGGRGNVHFASSTHRAPKHAEKGTPGDLIITGTPSGVGFARKPPEYLRVGDVVEVEIEGIGVLRNTIRWEDVRAR